MPRNQILQRQLAAALDIDTATYCKIEKGERETRREQVEAIVQILQIDKNELVTLWLADKVCRLIKNENSALRY